MDNSEFVRAATKMIPQAPDGPCVCVPGLFTLALELEHSQMALIQFFESFGFFWAHCILPSCDNRPELDDYGEYTGFEYFFPPR